jgi:hypothetical protein
MAVIFGQRFGVMRLSEQQFLPLARVGPTAPKQSGAKYLTFPRVAVQGPRDARIKVSGES